MKRILSLMIILFGLGFCPGPACFAEDKLHVVATQTLFADLVRQVGQDKVEVKAVASPQYNLHFIEPKPSDVRNVAHADLYVNGGLDLEAWSDPLLEAAGNPRLFRSAGRNLDLSQGIRLLNVPRHPVSRAQGDIHLFGNPHFHMNPENARVMVKAIAQKLGEIDPANRSFYEQNARDFLTKLDQKIAEWKNLCAPYKGKEVFSYHEDIAYLADFTGLKAEQFLEPKPGIPPSPKHMQFLQEYAKAHNVKAIVMPTYFLKDTAEALSRRIGGKVIAIAQEPGEIAGTEDFFSFFDYDFKQLSEGLKE